MHVKSFGQLRQCHKCQQDKEYKFQEDCNIHLLHMLLILELDWWILQDIYIRDCIESIEKLLHLKRVQHHKALQ
jgi:hypothetical protein